MEICPPEIRLEICLQSEPSPAAERLGVVICRTVAIAAMALRRTSEPLFPDTVPDCEVPNMRTKCPHGKFALHSIRTRGYNGRAVIRKARREQL